MCDNRKNTIYLTLRFFFLSPQQRGVVRSITVPPLFAASRQTLIWLLPPSTRSIAVLLSLLVCFLKHSKTCVTMLQYLLHRLTVSPDYSGQRSQLHKRLFVPTKPLPARLALMHQVSTCLHCRSSMVCCQQGLDTDKEGSVYYIHIFAHILCLFQPLLLSPSLSMQAPTLLVTPLGYLFASL